MNQKLWKKIHSLNLVIKLNLVQIKVCISFKTKIKNIKDPNDEYDLKSDNIGNDLPGQEKGFDNY